MRVEFGRDRVSRHVIVARVTEHDAKMHDLDDRVLRGESTDARRRAGRSWTSIPTCDLLNAPAARTTRGGRRGLSTSAPPLSPGSPSTDISKRRERRAGPHVPPPRLDLRRHSCTVAPSDARAESSRPS